VTSVVGAVAVAVADDSVAGVADEAMHRAQHQPRLREHLQQMRRVHRVHDERVNNRSQETEPSEGTQKQTESD